MTAALSLLLPIDTSTTGPASTSQFVLLVGPNGKTGGSVPRAALPAPPLSSHARSTTAENLMPSRHMGPKIIDFLPVASQHRDYSFQCSVTMCNYLPHHDKYLSAGLKRCRFTQ